MSDTTGKSTGLAQQSNRQSRVIIEKAILFGRCNECSFRCGNAAMRTWQRRTYSRLTMPAGFTDQQPGGTRGTTTQRKCADHPKVVELIPSELQY